jgi:hypothetical protein
LKRCGAASPEFFAGDLILFTLHPRPHRKISQPETWKVDEN